MRQIKAARPRPVYVGFTMKPSHRSARLAGIALLAALAASNCLAQSAGLRVTGSFGSNSNGGDVQGFFGCNGVPGCSGNYVAVVHDSNCTNSQRLNEAFAMSGLDLSAPGRIQGVVTLANADYKDIRNADGTCSIRPGTSQTITLPYTGRWNGSTGAFTMRALDDSGHVEDIDGTFTADVPGATTAFPMGVTGTIDFDRGDLSADVHFRSQDVAARKNIYVFAVAPSTRVKRATGGAATIVGLAAGASPKAVAVQCVIAQLTSSGELQAALASNLTPALSNVQASQSQAVTVLNNVATSQVAGATFYVGYGPSAAAMIADGVNRSAVAVPGAQTCFPSAPQTGWWWNPAEGGRGYSLEVLGNNLFFASYLYDASGRATWYAATGPTSLDGSLFVGRLIAFSGGQTLTGAFKPPAPATDGGAITLAFTDAAHGTMVWPGGAVPIERFNIVTDGLLATPLAAQPEAGWWWSPQEGGRGYFLEWQGANAFIAGYMYDNAGNPLWYASFMATPNPLVAQGSWTQFANGQTLSGAYKPAAPVNPNVGSLGIRFQDATSATLTLPDGRVVPIGRFRF
jgi:hypothetical protein